jgi:hypothetical protein
MAMQIEAPLIGRAGARPAPLTLEMTCWQGKVRVFSSMVQQGYDSVVTFPTPSLVVLGGVSKAITSVLCARSQA